MQINWLRVTGNYNFLTDVVVECVFMLRYGARLATFNATIMVCWWVVGWVGVMVEEVGVLVWNMVRQMSYNVISFKNLKDCNAGDSWEFDFPVSARITTKSRSIPLASHFSLCCTIIPTDYYNQQQHRVTSCNTWHHQFLNTNTNGQSREIDIRRLDVKLWVVFIAN